MPSLGEVPDVPAPPPYQNAQEWENVQVQSGLRSGSRKCHYILVTTTPEGKHCNSMTTRSRTSKPAWIPTNRPLLQIKDPMMTFQVSFKLLLPMRYFAECANHPVRKACRKNDKYSKHSVVRWALTNIFWLDHDSPFTPLDHPNKIQEPLFRAGRMWEYQGYLTEIL